MDITFEFATRDDCLDRMVPSDLRALVAERDQLKARIVELEGVVKMFLGRIPEHEFNDWDNCRAHDALNHTPAQSLAAVQAEVLEQTAHELYDLTPGGDSPFAAGFRSVKNQILERAAKLREAGL